LRSRFIRSLAIAKKGVNPMAEGNTVVPPTLPRATNGERRLPVPPPGVEIGAKVTAVILLVMIHTVLLWDVYAGMRWGMRNR
jgi:hypothetical protein